MTDKNTTSIGKTIVDFTFEDFVFICNALSSKVDHYRVMIAHTPPEDQEGLYYYQEQAKKALRIQKKVEYIVSNSGRKNG